MNKKVNIFSFVLIFLLGCANYFQDPHFLTIHTPPATPNDNAEARQKSNALAKDAWYFLNEYNNNPQRHDYDLIHAQNFFNFSWSWNRENYNVYWGWGIIRGIQATMTDDQPLIEKYLLQSVEFLSKVPEYDCPTDELGNLNLDLANAYNLLGSFYVQSHEGDKATVALQKAQKILEEWEGSRSKTGRVLYLSAINQFWQSHYKEAMEYVNKAKELDYPIPDDFMKNLEESLKEYSQ